jgi:predicted enzyme related to lactoylglutathione lyase
LQAGQHIGASLVNEPGTIMWNELITADPAAATAFYEQVLGLTTSVMDMGAGEYTLFEVNGQMVGGTTPPQMPGTPNHWHVYFAVADADASVAKITELGGSILVEPFDTPVGRMAVARDPQGATFSVMQPADQAA